MDDPFLGKLKRFLQYAIPWLPKGAIHPSKIQPSETIGYVLKTTANGVEWQPDAT